MENENGGMLDAESSGSLPRSRRQASDVRRKLFQSKDEMAAVVERCKLEQEFIRCVSLAPEPAVVLATDFQLRELQRCCRKHSVLSTFDLGNFYVTPVAFLHPMFHSRLTKKSPLFVGPMLIHKRMTFSTYHYFAAQLVCLCPDLKPIRAFGTDGEKALYQAFSAAFPEAIHLRCFKHFTDNVEQKLRAMNFDVNSRREIIADIMGVTHNGVKECGLSQSMIKSIRQKAGLGDSPPPFYTNLSESLNR